MVETDTFGQALKPSIRFQLLTTMARDLTNTIFPSGLTP